jgi:hypothetical protein
MNTNVIFANPLQAEINLAEYGLQAVGDSFVHALAAQDFDALQAIFLPVVRFRALVPSGERFGQTATEAAGWLRRWFGSADTLEVMQSACTPVFDRLYLNYRMRVHDEKGWHVIEQHAYCVLQGDQIADMWLICSGFRPDAGPAVEFRMDAYSEPTPRLGGDVFYNAGSKGCAEGPFDEIVRLMRLMKSGQTLEIYATDPSVAGDLPAWCRLSGHEFIRQDGSYFLIRYM